uniref:Uncharacterized protein n=1 Tax=Canis lupus familiaris TaxID=9615 RepID=A0A8C0PGP8_CANLF
YIGLPAWSLLLPLPVSLSLLFYFRTVWESAPSAPSTTCALCLCQLLIAVTFNSYVYFHLFHWLGIKKFQHN